MRVVQLINWWGATADEELNRLRPLEISNWRVNYGIFFPKAILKRKKELTSDLDMCYYQVSKFMYVTKYFPLINW